MTLKIAKLLRVAIAAHEVDENTGLLFEKSGPWLLAVMSAWFVAFGLGRQPPMSCWHELAGACCPESGGSGSVLYGRTYRPVNSPPANPMVRAMAAAAMRVVRWTRLIAMSCSRTRMRAMSARSHALRRWST